MKYFNNPIHNVSHTHNILYLFFKENFEQESLLQFTFPILSPHFSITVLPQIMAWVFISF